MKHSRKGYVLCLSGLLFLVLAAFFGPYFIFRIQDGYRMEKVYREERSGLDIQNLNYTYESRIGERMGSLAQGLAEGKNYKVVSTDYEITQEIWEYALKARNQEWISFMKEIGLLSLFTVDGASEVLECKRYVIYEGNLENGAELILWYLKIRLVGTDMVLLIDAQSESIYYMELVKLAGNTTQDDRTAIKYYGYDDDAIEEILYEYYFSYYEGNYVHGKSNEKTMLTMLNQEGGLWEYELPYGENHLNFEIRYEGGRDIYDARRLQIGIRQIAELIKQNS